MKTPPCQSTAYLAFAFSLSCASSLCALQTINDSLEVTQGFTLRGDALLEGSTAFGKLPSQSTPGYVTDVYQGISTVDREDIIPAHTEYQQVWVDDYGTINSSVWIDEYGWNYMTIWVADQYDEEGNVSVPAHYENQQTWGITGGYWNPVCYWGVTGGHYENQGVWINEQHNTYTETIFGIPVVRFTGQRQDVVWSWRNSSPSGGMRELMALSPAGLSLPHPEDTYAKAVLTSTNFEQSYTTPSAGNGAGQYFTFGVRMQKDQIELWNDGGTPDGLGGVNMTSSKSLEIKAHELQFEDRQPTGDGATTQTVATRIAATSASFGGNVSVNGTLLVQPQGDLVMGAYTNGPTP